MPKNRNDKEERERISSFVFLVASLIHYLQKVLDHWAHRDSATREALITIQMVKILRKNLSVCLGRPIPAYLKFAPEIMVKEDPSDRIMDQPFQSGD
jgi:hypothetical protein